MLDAACQPAPRLVTHEGLEQEVTTLLKRGLTTPSGGGFLLWPYLRAFQIDDRLTGLLPGKQAGFPPLALGLCLLFETLYGYHHGIRAIDPISRADFGLLAGLPCLPAASAEYRFLQAIATQQALDEQVSLTRYLSALGRIPGGTPLNIDAHNVRSFSRKEMKRSYLPDEKGYGKAVRLFYTQEQSFQLPLIAFACYSGTTVSQATPSLMTLTQQAVGTGRLLVADKEWYCGHLLQELRQMDVTVLTPIKQSAGRRAEFERIPLDQYLPTLEGKIATIATTLTDYTGPLVAFVKERAPHAYFALLTTEADLQADTALPTFSDRWHIENFFGLNNALGVDQLPSLNLNAIQAMLTIRLMAFHVFAAFRQDLGGKFAHQSPELIRRQFLLPVQAKIQSRSKQTISVTVYGCAQQHVLKERYQEVSEQLRTRDIDPRLPWLGNRKLEVRFV